MSWINHIVVDELKGGIPRVNQSLIPRYALIASAEDVVSMIYWVIVVVKEWCLRLFQREMD